MGQYKKAIITAAGEGLIAKAIAGEIQLNITKAKTSDYKYPEGTDLKKMTDMRGVKQVMTSPETKVLETSLIQTRLLFSNEGIQATYYIQNIGLYALDRDREVLFCIVTAETPDEMPKYNKVASTSFIYNINNVVQGAEQLSITVNPSGSASIQDVMERVKSMGGDISETVICELDLISEKFPIPSTGEKTKTFLSKVKKSLEDWKIFKDGIITMGQLVNNGLTTEPGFALDARYGKSLQDQINTTKSNLNDKAPTQHASAGTTYGIGNAGNFGHVKLSDSYTASQGAAANGVGASSKAVCELYNILKYTKGASFNPDAYFSSKNIYAYIKNGSKSFYLDGLTKTNLLANTAYYLGTLTPEYRPVTFKMIPVYVDNGSSKYTLTGYIKIAPAGNVDLELTSAVSSGKYLLAGACYE